MTWKKIQLQLESVEQTENLGLQLGKHLLPNDMVCLEGSLGAGKTTLTQAIGRGIEVDDSYYINSPSFNILHEYPARLPFYHMDFYRLGGSDEVLDMGLDEYFFNGGVTVIEWASKAEDILPEERLEIYLEQSGATSRIARITAHGKSWADRIASISSTHVEAG